MSGDFDITPGPERKTAETNLTLFIWNLNLHSIHAQNFANLCLLKSYVFIIYLECLFKTYLDSETLFDDEKLKIENCRLIRYDHPCNTDRSCVCGVCVHYKIRLSLKVLGIHQFFYDGFSISQSKPMDCFLYDWDLLQERVNFKKVFTFT